MAKRARCFRCKKMFPLKAKQHPKFSLCPACKSFKEEFGSESSWLDHGFAGPSRRG